MAPKKKIKNNIIKTRKNIVRVTKRSTPTPSKNSKKITKKPVKKAKKKQKGYYVGIHNSTKCSTPVQFKSGWERVVCEYLDISSDVDKYEYEPFSITYVSNKKSGKTRQYFPDFLITFTDGSTKMVEVKPIKKIKNATVIKKANAAREWCSNNGVSEYVFWTETEIKQFKKLVKMYSKANGS